VVCVRNGRCSVVPVDGVRAGELTSGCVEVSESQVGEVVEGEFAAVAEFWFERACSCRDAVRVVRCGASGGDAGCEGIAEP
jgi:hypothetical protein